jgi:hypothetical protein
MAKSYVMIYSDSNIHCIEYSDTMIYIIVYIYIIPRMSDKSEYIYICTHHIYIYSPYIYIYIHTIYIYMYIYIYILPDGMPETMSE